MFAPSNEKEGYLLNEQLWKDKVVDIMEERNLFSECKKENIDPHLVLFEALAYSNQELTNLTLQLIHRLANQRREMLKTFKDIILVAGGHLSKLATRGVQITRSVLLTLTSLTIR